MMAAIAVPVIGGTLDRERTIVGAQYLAGQLQRARLESLKRARSVAVRLEIVGRPHAVAVVRGRQRQRRAAAGHRSRHRSAVDAAGVARRSSARHLACASTRTIIRRRRRSDARARRRSAAHRQHVASDVQPARQCHERHALCRGSSGSTDGDSGLRSDRPCPRVDVRCADAAMAPVAIDLIERRRERRSPGGGARWQPLAAPPSRSTGHAPQHQQPRGARRIRRAAASWRAYRNAARGRRQSRASVRGRLDRCHVAALEPLRYRGVLMFDERVELRRRRR